jgi:translation initiation factor IF-2
MLNEVEEVVHSMVEPEEEIEEIARAEVKQVFTLTNGKQVAGCQVISGTILKGYKAYVERDKEELGEGKIVSLKCLKNDIKEAKKGTECGIILEPAVQFEKGDFVVCYKVV